MEWTVDEARERFDDLLDAADDEGPQVIFRDGKRYRVTAKNPPEGEEDFIDFLMSAPGLEGVNIERDKRPLREIEWSHESNRLVEIITNGPPWDGVEGDEIRGTMRDIDLE